MAQQLVALDALTAAGLTARRLRTVGGKMIDGPVKERPLLCPAHEVRAILAGHQTQFRRVIRLQPTQFTHVDYDDDLGWHLWWDVCESCGDPNVWQETAPMKPPGQPGDRLWCRETWAQSAYSGRALHTDQPVHEVTINYRADGASRQIRLGEHEDSGRVKADGTIAWRPSTQMPKWASRITLEVTDVRVQRVQEISHDDVFAEGMTTETLVGSTVNIHKDGKTTEATMMFSSPTYAFTTVWNSLNAKRGHPWDSNPWIWAVTFKRVQP